MTELVSNAGCEVFRVAIPKMSRRCQGQLAAECILGLCD